MTANAMACKNIVGAAEIRGADDANVEFGLRRGRESEQPQARGIRSAGATMHLLAAAHTSRASLAGRFREPVFVRASP
jgi:hypothetical protein